MLPSTCEGCEKQNIPEFQCGQCSSGWCVMCVADAPVASDNAVDAAGQSGNWCKNCLHVLVHTYGFQWPSVESLQYHASHENSTAPGSAFTACSECDSPAYIPTNAVDKRTQRVLCNDCATVFGRCSNCTKTREDVCVHFCGHCTLPLCCECQPHLGSFTNSTCRSCVRHAALAADADVAEAKRRCAQLEQTADEWNIAVKRLKTQ